MHTEHRHRRVLAALFLPVFLFVPKWIQAAEPASPGQHSQRSCPSAEGAPPVGLEGIQIEAADIALHERFFAEILEAPEVQLMEHPQVDRLRGYCYRGVVVVVRQDLTAARPTGWVQLNFAVEAVATIHDELAKTIQARLANLAEPERARVVRLKLKPDVRRGPCRATRLEIGGPEGFMIGLDQVKPETCRPSGHGRQESHGEEGERAVGQEQERPRP